MTNRFGIRKIHTFVGISSSFIPLVIRNSILLTALSVRSSVFLISSRLPAPSRSDLARSTKWAAMSSSCSVSKLIGEISFRGTIKSSFSCWSLSSTKNPSARMTKRRVAYERTYLPLRLKKSLSRYRLLPPVLPNPRTALHLLDALVFVGPTST